MKDEIKEIKIYKANKSITFINNGIAFSQFGVADEILDLIINLQEQLHQASLDIQELTEKDIGCPSWCDKLTNLQEKYDKALELLNEYGVPCERDNFNLLDTDYCELNCSNDEEQFKKCWNEFIEWRLKDE